MSDRTDIEQQVYELEQKAQRAAEERLELAHASLDEDVDEELVTMLAGPYCGCLTCEVREVLHAAYPFLRDIALLEAGLGPLLGTSRPVNEVIDEVRSEYREALDTLGSETTIRPQP